MLRPDLRQPYVENKNPPLPLPKGKTQKQRLQLSLQVRSALVAGSIAAEDLCHTPLSFYLSLSNKGNNYLFF